MQTSLTYRTNRDLFSNHYLDEHLPETEEWNEVSDDELQAAYEDIEDLWNREKATASKRNESQLEEKFIRPMFRKLGIPFEVEESTSRTQRRPDYGFFETDEAAREAFGRREAGNDFYRNSVAVADAKRWGRPLDTRGSGEHERDFENPSYQIHVYLQETPTRWAVLTNGKKWRLYYGPTSHRLDSYYEVDLPTILEKGDREDFKYFYLFFRHEAFLEDAGGDNFLDDVYDESNVFARELGADLQDNIYEAIKVLSEGFLQYPENDLDEDDLDLVHDSSLIYLYRAIFVLYAEAEGRDLLDTDNEIYEQSYSLNSLKQEIAEELDSASPKYRDWRDDLWSRLDELFKLIDQGSKSRGIPEDDLYIPAYNGGLFRTNPGEDDSREARFLATHRVGDAYLAKVIELLTRSRNGNGGKIFVDYSSLDVRHLGSIYEGLLEYQLNVADEPLALDGGEYVTADEGDDVEVQEGEVYLTTDSGERKATGSYYTPEYVVEYIVENTLEPLITDIRNDLMAQSGRGDHGFAAEFAERVFDLKILDPAMGSGHFLTSVIDYLAREIIDAQEKQAAQQGIETVDEEHDINWARRQVAQRCIYGVDLNPLAVELAKVSLWLRTLAAEQPLAFLDHHLKTGNSLVGSDVEEIEELESESGGDGQNASLADFGVARKGTIEQLMRIYQDFIAIENQDLADVKAMESKYDEFERNKLRQRLEAMANVHTAEAFGLDNLPSDAYERMAAAIEDDEEWTAVEQIQWFRDAQTWADENDYFHWKLEYPEVFYDENGDARDEAGFDAVIGNPPYVRIQNIKETDPATVAYFNDTYETTYQNYDLAVPFTELGYGLLRDGGIFGYIETKKWIQGEYGEKLREFLVERAAMRELVDFGDQQVFPGASTYTILLFLQKDAGDEFRYAQLYDLEGDVSQLRRIDSDGDFVDGDMYAYAERFENLGASPWVFTLPGEREILTKMGRYPALESIADTIFVGLQTSADPIYIVQVEDERDDELQVYSKELDQTFAIEKGATKPILRGKDITKWSVSEYENRVIFPYRTDLDAETYELFSEETLRGRFPNTWEYLCENESRLLGRADVNEETWWEYPYPKNLEKFDAAKLMTQVLADEASFAIDEDGEFAFVGGGNAGGYGITLDDDVIDDRALLALLNSSLLDWKLKKESSQFRGGYYSYAKRYIKKLPICLDAMRSDAGDFVEAKQFDGESCETALASLVETGRDAVEELRQSNTHLPDYLGSYDAGPTLGELPGQQPASGLHETILVDTAADKESLRVGDVDVSREGSKTVLELSARYKPEDENEHETDRWGYTETELIPAMEFVDLGERERALVEEFVPYAVEEAGGFASFRETATKTNSLVDRLAALTLPVLEDVSSGLERYLEAREQTRQLRREIREAEALIDTLVYEMYDIDEEQRAVVESALEA